MPTRRRSLTLACLLLIGCAAEGVAQPRDFKTHTDTIPNFAHAPTIVSARAGNWSDASTWKPSRVPTAQDVVHIVHEVTYDAASGSADVVGIDAGARLLFATNQSTRLRVGVLEVMPNGALEIGTPEHPVEPQVTAEIVIASRGLDLERDPSQWGTGIVVVDGRVTMHGAPKALTFVRTAVEPLAGQTVLQLEQPVPDWRPGEEIFVPDSSQVSENDKFNPNYVLRVDRMKIERVSSDGRLVTLAAPLVYDHRGARNADGSPTVLADGTKLLPHVGNLSRNIVIRSENPRGVRGHTAYTHRATVHLAYVQFQDLGRTRATVVDRSANHIGRYPLHIHHLWGPPNPDNTGYQFEVVGNAVNDSLKWPIAVHGSHYGLIKDNVVFGGSDLTGSGIAVEDGSESENRFERNFVAVIRGDINPRESGSDTQTPGSGAECYWAAGYNNRFIDNVASDCRNAFQQVVSGPGFKFFAPPAAQKVENPRFRGANMGDGGDTREVTLQRQPLLEFRGNEVYGGSASGFTAWHLGTDGYDMPTMPESVIADFRVWHVHESAIWNYPVNHLTVDGLIYRVDPDGMVYWQPAIQSGDYRAIDLTIRGGDIHGGAVFGGSVAPLGTLRIDGVRATTREHAFQFSTPKTPGTRAGIPDPPGITAILRNNIVNAWPGRHLQTIATGFDSGPDTFPDVRYDIHVQDYQGQPGNNFRVFWREQANRKTAGSTAPCNNTGRPEIQGITCVTGEVPPR